MPLGYVKARRAHSMPSRFVLPSMEMGEYEDGRRRSAPAKGGLYPLREEGTYGRPPQAPPPPPPPYKGRDKKPKIYSSYAIDHGCKIHSKTLEEKERDHGSEHIAAPRYRRPSYGVSRASASPVRAYSRGPSSERSTVSPDPGVGGRKNSAKSWTSTSTSSVSHRYSTSNGHRYNDLRDSSFEENEEYEYEENQRSNKKDHDRFTRDIERRMNAISIHGMRTPKISSWDSMGILGLSNKMWHDTKKRQESFMQTTGHFLREDDTLGPYIM